MAIYRGAGGAGDATGDSASEALLIRELAAEVTADANAANTAAINAEESAALAATYTPSQTGNAGKFLTTNGTSTSWGVADALPSQTGNAGEYLTTDGTNASWAAVPKVGMVNRIINGAMVIEQRNAGNDIVYPTNGQYTLDRWQSIMSPNPGKYSIQRNAGSVTPPPGFTNYLGVTSLSSYSVSATDIYGINQQIEGFNVSDLGWGTAAASSVTLSFWVRSSLTGTFGGSFRNWLGNRAYPFSYTINAANTWELKSITLTGDTTGSWLTNNSPGIMVHFGLGVGSSRSGTAGSWSGSNFFSATGATSVVGTNGATFYLTGVQLEKGSTSNSFDYRYYGTELALCQRYYYLLAFGSLRPVMTAANYTSNDSRGVVSFPVSMRATPTLTSSSGIAHFRYVSAGSISDCSSMISDIVSTNAAELRNNTSISVTSGNASYVLTVNSAALLSFSSEL